MPQAVEKDQSAGRFALSILSRAPSPREGLQITWLERHPHSAQTFVPLKGASWLLVLAPSGEEGQPLVQNAQAYICGPQDAVSIAPMVWHAGMTVFDVPADFAMWMWKAEDGSDGDVYTLAEPLNLFP